MDCVVEEPARGEGGGICGTRGGWKEGNWGDTTGGGGRGGEGKGGMVGGSEGRVDG